MRSSQKYFVRLRVNFVLPLWLKLNPFTTKDHEGFHKGLQRKKSIIHSFKTVSFCAENIISDNHQ